jgi:endonuclease YncB( thermonuclease family)
MALSLAVVAGTVVPAVTTRAQAVDVDDGQHAAPAAAPAPGLDQDVNPSKPLPLASQPPEAPHDNIQGGVRVQLLPSDQSQDSTGAQPGAQPGATPLVTAMPTGDLPEPVNLDHPAVVDTAKLTANGKTVPLFGIVGQSGEPAKQLEGYMAATDGHLTCPAQTTTDYVCMLSDGTDIAMVALRNGAARTREDAPEAYRAQEILAQGDRFGIWSNLPPPPAVINHPTVKDTATLTSGTQTYVLDGLIGMGPPYAAQLQGYITSHGDSLSCEPQAVQDHYICVLNDGTDIAKVALVNGAASVAPDAPDSYRVQQLEALNNKRGLWLNPPPNFVVANAAVAPPDACCVFVAGDDGGDGITYVGGEPTAVIDGATVFLVLAAGAGWGYYDHYHHWREAPGRYRSHLERFHPNGQGLRAYRGQGIAGRPGTVGHASFASAGRPGGPAGFGAGAGLNHAGVAGGVGRPGMAPGVGHPGFATGAAPGVGHPGFATGAAPGVGHPGFATGAAPGLNHAGAANGFGRPGGMAPVGNHPGFAPGGGAGLNHTGFTGGGRPPMGGGGFMHPTATSAPSFHPAGMGAAPHIAAAPHVSAPAPHVTAAAPIKHR